MIYFDNSATTAIYPAVLDTYIKTTQRIVGNPSSLHELGNQAERLLEKARNQIAELLEVQASEIYFTSGGTEGDNWVIKGTALEKRMFGKHLIISEIEHPAVKESARQMESLGFEIDWLPVDKKGYVVPKKLQQLIRKDTILVSIMAVNNEIGTIQPIKEISKILEAFPTIHFHVDAVQALGKVAYQQWFTPRVDFATFSAHKFHGPKGSGFIYWRSGKKLASLLSGGGQEKNTRSGTENVAGNVAMAKACRFLLEDQEKKQHHERNIKKYLLDSLHQYEKVHLFSEDNALFAPHILCFALKGVRGEVLVHALEEKQIFISTTSACSSKRKAKESTLQAMRVPEDLASSAVRVSLDEQNTLAEAEQFMVVFNQLYQKFSKIT